MNVVYYQDKIEGLSRYNLTITDYNLTKVIFTDFDRVLLGECEKSNKISDKVLALEMITRRIEEANQ